MAAVNQEIKQKQPTEEVLLWQLQEPQREMRVSCVKDLVKVRILPDDDRSFQIGVSMKDEDRVGMLLFLVQNVDVFAWSPYEVPGVDPKFIVH